jgi:hypothetical protein
MDHMYVQVHAVTAIRRPADEGADTGISGIDERRAGGRNIY